MSSDRDDEAIARAHLDQTSSLLGAVDLRVVVRVVDALRSARERGATVYVAGNGGSAATASHFATDLSRRTPEGGGPRVRAISLTDNIAWMTALANDLGYEHVFAGQLRALARRGDVLVAISASGNSPSILRAVEAAREAGAATIALIGFDGGQLRSAVDLAVHVASDQGLYGPVEDVHVAIHHAVAACLAQG
jgi:D-sedoheptulose 7-phosphate isomerase